MDDDTKIILCFLAAAVLVIVMFAINIPMGKDAEHKRNMECIAAGKTYQPISQEDSRFICK